MVTGGADEVVPPLLEDGPPPSLADFLIDAAAYGVAWGVPVWVMLVTLWSMDFYGRVTLTRSTLRVGRERLPVADLDPVGARAVDRNHPSLSARVRASAGDLHLPRMRVEGVRYLGGSYGTPYGMDSVTLPLRDGSGVRFYTRDRGALLTALNDVLPGA